MRAKGSKAARTKRAGNGAGSSQAGSCPLLVLPMEVLHQVLGMLDPHDLIKLLQTSKAMAQEIMQQSAGRLTVKVELQREVNMVAIRQLLQWATPSSLKLVLQGDYVWGSPSRSNWGVLSTLFNPPCAALAIPSSQHELHMQQFPCILEAHVKGFTLPSLVPADLVAMCPNMHTLKLYYCTVHGGSDCNSSNGSTNVLHTLILDVCEVPCLKGLTGNDRATARATATIQHVEQVKRSLSNVTCLTLQHGSGGLQLLPVVGSQLTELHYADAWGNGLGELAMHKQHLQQLQKLVLPNTEISRAGDIGQLLSLPSLIHIELDSVDGDSIEDHSSHPCKWQYLHLHLHQTLYIDSLAKLPLHSLTHPLKLGNDSRDCVEVYLPLSSQQKALTSLETLAQQLMRCGVEIVGTHVVWEPLSHLITLGAEVAPSFKIMGPAFGHLSHVQMADILVDPPVMQSLATVYGPRLAHLELQGRLSTADMQPAWHAALSGLPSLVKLTLHGLTGFVEHVRTLAAAMSQQPAGRCLDVQAEDMHYYHSNEVIALVKNGAGQELAGVDITVNDRAGQSTMHVCVCLITRKRAL